MQKALMRLGVSFVGAILLLGGVLHLFEAPALGAQVETSTGTAPAVQSKVNARVVTALEAAETTRVLVTLQDPVDVQAPAAVRAAKIAQVQDAVLASLPATDFSVVRRYKLIPGLVGTVSQSGLKQLQADPLVVAVQPDERVHAHLSQSVAALQADLVQQTYGFTGENIVVAVLDTGIDTDNPDFSGRIIAQHCFTNGDCPPGDSDEGTSAEDENGHGTNVTGIVGSSGAASYVGFAPDVDIVAVRVLDASSSGFLSDWLAGLDWILDNLDTYPVRVINMSLGTNALYTGNCDSTWPLVANTTAQLNAAGVVIFASSGNAGSSTSIGSPACNSGVVAVGATYDGDLGREPDSGTYNSLFGGSWPSCFDDPTNLLTVTCFSNSNSTLDILAPGARISASGLGGAIWTYRGTSQASPTAAGIAALLLDASPNLSPAAVESVLKSSGTAVTDPKNGLQFPTINALDALMALPEPEVSLLGPVGGEAGISYTFSAIVTPLTTTQPVTYAWEASGQEPVTHTADSLADNISFTWSTDGTKSVAVRVSNARGTAVSMHTIDVTIAPDSVTINGPSIGTPGHAYTYTAAVAPPTATQPITYMWAATGQATVLHTGGVTDTKTFTWSSGGEKTITVTTMNIGGTAETTHVTTILVPAERLDVDGPTQGVISETYTFSATVQPVTITQPITYVWAASGQVPVTHTNGLSDHVDFTWPMTGVQTVTVTAINAAGTLSHVRAITIVTGALTAVEVMGPESGLTLETYTFEAAVMPLTAIQPITYNWQVSGFEDVSHSAGITDTLTLAWSQPGPKTITVTATNVRGSVAYTHSMTISMKLHLPVIRRD